MATRSLKREALSHRKCPQRQVVPWAARPTHGRCLLLKTSFLSKSRKHEGLNVSVSRAVGADVSVRFFWLFLIHLKCFIISPQPLTAAAHGTANSITVPEVYFLVFSGLAPFYDVGPSIRTIISVLIYFEIAFLPALSAAGRVTASEWGGGGRPPCSGAGSRGVSPREGRLSGAR